MFLTVERKVNLKLLLAHHNFAVKHTFVKIYKQIQSCKGKLTHRKKEIYKSTSFIYLLVCPTYFLYALHIVFIILNYIIEEAKSDNDPLFFSPFFHPRIILEISASLFTFVIRVIIYSSLFCNFYCSLHLENYCLYSQMKLKI